MSVGGNNGDKYLNNSLNLGTFCFKLKHLFVSQISQVYGLDKRVIGENSQLFVPTRKGSKNMMNIKSSSKLREYLMKEAKAQTIKVDKPCTFSVLMAFGCAKDDIINNMSYFDEEPENVMLFSQEDPEDPREKRSAAALSLASKEYPGLLNAYLL